MSLDDIVQVSITAQTTTPSRPGFGTPLILAYHTRWTSDRVREYSSLSEMTDDGFVVTDNAYLAATKVFSQNPRPRKVKVGRRTRAFTQTVDLTPINVTLGFVYNVTIGGVTAAYTNGASETVATVCTALAAAINALSNTALHTATATTTKVTVATVTAGNVLDYTDMPDAANMAFKNVTADPGVVTDLTECRSEDDDFYGILLDSESQAEVVALAANVETLTKLFVFNTSDTECFNNSSTTDVFAVLKAASYARTIGLFSHKQLQAYSGAAWMGNRFVAVPGSDTWAHKTLKGVTADVLASGRVNAILAKRASVYTTVAEVAVTQFGKSFSGEWADVTRFIDWLKSEVQIRVFARLANSEKIEYTDSGVDIIKSVILGALEKGVTVKGLAAGTIGVDAPLVADVDPTTKGERILPDVTFFGTLAGAIHTIQIAGTLSI